MPESPLIRLPTLIRHRIYRFVGLASWDGFPYTFDQHGPDRKSDNWSREERYPFIFHGLLLSCRDIYADAAALLYSANRYIIHYTNPGSLEPSLALTASALSSLTTLSIILNKASCHQRTRHHSDRDCCIDSYSCIQSHDSLHQPPLLTPTSESDDSSSDGSSSGDSSSDDSSSDGNSSISTAAQALLGEWHAVASHLSSHITPRRLELSLVCDIDPQHTRAVDLANSTIAPLRLLPLLRNCHIRLCKTLDPRLLKVARDAVLQSCGTPPPPYLKPSSTKATFLTLPRELRLRILELTDLVTPGEVWWGRHPDDSKYVWMDLGGGSRCWDETYPRCQFWECWVRSRRNMPAEAGRFISCFCRRRHAAFSTTCTCWVPPGPDLFLVCRAWYQDAQLVFFSANRFIVHDFELLGTWGLENPEHDAARDLRYPYPFKCLAASQFLRQVVPPHCISYLRFLELGFPPYRPPTWPPTDHPAMQDWRETVGWLRGKIKGLTLRVAGAEIYYGASPAYTSTITVAEGDMIHRAYMDLLQPLKQLTESDRSNAGGLVRFYANLLYPWQWTDEVKVHHVGEKGRAWLRDRVRDLKKELERRVLGDDGYEKQYANGREEPEQSLWQHVFYHHD